MASSSERSEWRAFHSHLMGSLSDALEWLQHRPGPLSCQEGPQTRLPLETSALPPHTDSLPRGKREQVEPGGPEPHGSEAGFAVRQTWKPHFGAA